MKKLGVIILSIALSACITNYGDTTPDKVAASVTLLNSDFDSTKEWGAP